MRRSQRRPAAVFLRASVTVALAVLVTGCGARATGNPALAPPPPAAAAPAETARLTEQPLTEAVPDGTPRAPLQPDETLVRVLTVNLDADDEEEQVVVVRVAPADQAPERPIKVAVLDFDGSAATYLRTWEAVTQAGAARTFDLTVRDLIGDHHLEIVARGINAAGERTLDAYRQTAAAGAALGFAPIIALATRGTIELPEPERSEDYLLRRSQGLPVAIVTYAEDPRATESTAVIRTDYRWQAATGRYQAAPPERLPGTFVEGSLRALFASSGTAQFERHLAGPWYRLVQPDPTESLMSRIEIILFEPEQRRITLFDGDVQEIYVWDISHRLLAPRLGIWAHNELVHSIARTINVEVLASDEIRVAMKGDDQDHYADGNYRRVDDQVRDTLARSGVIQPGLVELHLTGLYRDNSGQSINFEPPRFTWQAGEERLSGAYAVYSLGQLVIVFKVMSAAGVTREVRTYTADYGEQRRGERLLRSLVLRPATLTITGVTGIGATALHFEQVEILDATAAQDNGAAAAAGAIIITAPAADGR